MSSILEYESSVVFAERPAPAWDIAYMSFASKPAHIAEMRRRMRELLTASWLSRETLADVETAVGEACTNALRHGSPKGELDEVRIKCMLSERSVVVEISDNGFGFDPKSLKAPIPETLGQGGMGVFLMRALMDQVEFSFDEGTTVRLVKHKVGLPDL